MPESAEGPSWSLSGRPGAIVWRVAAAPRPGQICSNFGEAKRKISGKAVIVSGNPSNLLQKSLWGTPA